MSPGRPSATSPLAPRTIPRRGPGAPPRQAEQAVERLRTRSLGAAGRRSITDTERRGPVPGLTVLGFLPIRGNRNHVPSETVRGPTRGQSCRCSGKRWRLLSPVRLDMPPVRQNRHRISRHGCDLVGGDSLYSRRRVADTQPVPYEPTERVEWIAVISNPPHRCLQQPSVLDDSLVVRAERAAVVRWTLSGLLGLRKFHESTPPRLPVLVSTGLSPGFRRRVTPLPMALVKTNGLGSRKCEIGV